jgi:signal peptide peptidase SppA
MTTTREQATGFSTSKVAEAVFGQPWLLRPEKLTEIGEFLVRRDLGIELQNAFEAAPAAPEHPFKVIDGVAVVPVFGVVSKRINMLGRISGGTSTDLLRRDLQAALDDDDVRAILLDVDSPGGNAQGPFELSDFLYASRGTKPIVAVANEEMSSGAYLIGSAADDLVALKSSTIGSIGVVVVHREFSRANEKSGVAVTVFRAGEFKAMPSNVEPLTDAAREVVDDHLAVIYDLFVAHVARNRNRKPSTVREKWATGKVWLGDEAKALGLIDRIGTLDSTLDRLAGRDVVPPANPSFDDPPLESPSLRRAGVRIAIECENVSLS